MKLEYKYIDELAKTLGDSFYVIDIEKFRDNYISLKEAFRRYYPKTDLAYSYKTNYIPKICKTVDEEGGYAEVVSDMEYDLAIKIGVDPKRIIVNGPYKPYPHLEKFLLNQSIVNFDSYSEVDSLKIILGKYNDIKLNIGLRCNFDIGSGTKSRFGFDTDNEKFYKLIEELFEYKNINFVNLHCHFPNRDLKYSEIKVDNIIKIYKRIYKNGKPLMIDLGGGLGGNISDFVRKQLPFKVSNYNDYAHVIGKKFSEEFGNGKDAPTLIIEPGTALVADTMKFVSRIIEIKKIRGSFIAIVSGSKVNFNPMASMINLPINVYSYNESGKEYYNSIDISGYTCMEGDYLHKGYQGYLNIGDFIEVENVGSYSVVFKPPFILPNVPIIAFIEGKMNILKKSEDFDYIFQTYNLD